jgi:hypothetical protein
LYFLGKSGTGKSPLATALGRHVSKPYVGYEFLSMGELSEGTINRAAVRGGFKRKSLFPRPVERLVGGNVIFQSI